MTTAAIITAVRIPERPFAILNGTVITPPAQPTIVIILKRTNSVGRSCPKKRLLISINFFTLTRLYHYFHIS
jgi:hypothetical protein